MIVFRNSVDDGDTVLTLSLRSGFWIFIVLSGALVIHNKLLMRDIHTETKLAAYDSLFTNSYTGGMSNGTTNILPEVTMPNSISSNNVVPHPLWE